MGAWRIGRVAGIELRVHVSFLLVVLLGAMQWGGLGPRGALFGALLTLLTFASVTLHELGHSLVARGYGIPVRDITLYPIGGVASLSRRPRTPGQELLIALAGPAVNVVLAAVFGALGVALVGSEALWAAMARAGAEQPTGVTLLAMVVSSNVVLAVFNLVPALPMDGGRVLRALLSWVLGPELATRASAVVARVLAVGLVALGLLGNPMLAVIGVFVFFAAGQEVQAHRLERVLEGVRAGDALNPWAPRVRPATTVGEALPAVLGTPYQAFAVEHFGRLVGVVWRGDLLRAAEDEGPGTYVAGLARRDVPTVDARDSLEVAHQRMNEAASPCVAVLRDGLFLGLVTEVELAQQHYLAQQLRGARDRRGAPRDLHAHR